MSSTKLMTASIALDGVSNIAITGATAECDYSICFCEYSKWHSQGERSEESGEVHLWKCGIAS